MAELIDVLYVHHSGAIGGAPRSLGYLYQESSKQFRTKLCAIKDGPVREFFAQLGIKADIVPGITVLHGSIVSGWRWKRFVKQCMLLPVGVLSSCRMLLHYSPRIVHLNSTCLAAVAIAAKLLFWKKFKVVCHVREPLLFGFRGRPLRFVSWAFCDYLIAISRYDAKSLGWAEAKCDVVYNFYPDVSPITRGEGELLRQKIGCRPNSRILLFAARVTEENGVETLCETLKSLDLWNLNCDVIVVGFRRQGCSPFEKKMLEELGKILGVFCESQVEDVAPYFSLCEGVVIPFLKPHASRTQIEAMAYKKLVIASDIPSINEVSVSGEDAVLFAPGDSFHLAVAIRRFCELSQAELESMQMKGYEKGQKFFNMQRNANAICDIYRRFP